MTHTVTSHRAPATAPALARRTAGLLRRSGHAARRHWLLLVALALGVALRVLVLRAYPQAFWLQGDSQSYLGTAYSLVPFSIRPSGYSLFLAVLVRPNSVALIVTVQHLIGLAIAVAAYVLLQRRGVARIWSVLATLPLLLDARTVTLEHYLLAETFFTALLVAAVVLLLWRDRPAAWQLAAVGLLFALAAVTRSVGLIAIAAPALYLVVRRLGWRQFGAFALAVALPIGGYLLWYHHTYQTYSFTSYSGRFLWARTTTFMDCGRLDPTPAERPICPTEALGHRPAPDEYLWAATSVHKYQTPAGDAIHAGLARKAILRQPGDYLRVVADESWSLMLPGVPAGYSSCTLTDWDLPAGGPEPCQRKLAPTHPAVRHFVGYVADQHGTLQGPLHTYSRFATVPGGVAGLAFLLALVAAVFRRRSSWRDRLDPVLLTGLALGMIVVSVATAAADTRYVVPSLPFAMIGAGLALRSRVRESTVADPDPLDVSGPPGTPPPGPRALSARIPAEPARARALDLLIPPPPGVLPPPAGPLVPQSVGAAVPQPSALDPPAPEPPSGIEVVYLDPASPNGSGPSTA